MIFLQNSDALDISNNILMRCNYFIQQFVCTTKTYGHFVLLHFTCPITLLPYILGAHDHDEDCMCLIGKREYKWQDFKCDTHMFFICEKAV